MKNVLLMAGLLLLPGIARSQQQTLFDGDIESGGFGGARIILSRISNDAAVFVGGEGAWLINHTFYLGGGAYGLATTHYGKERLLGVRQRLEMGYGGLILGYIARPDNLVHVTIHTLIGAGGGAMMLGSRFDDWDDGDLLDDNAFFVAEPGAGVYLNVTHFFQIGVDGSYRFVSGERIGEFSSNDLSGPAGTLTLRFGKF